MSIVYTTVTERADYDGIVLSSTPVVVSATAGRTDPVTFRRVELDDSSDGYFSRYQVERYHSFGCLVLSEEQFEQEVDQGFIVLGELPA
jgi:hypothetical protein